MSKPQSNEEARKKLETRLTQIAENAPYKERAAKTAKAIEEYVLGVASPLREHEFYG